MNRVGMNGSVATGSAGPRLSIFGVVVTIVVGVVAGFAIMAATGVFDDDREVVTTSAASDSPREIDGILRFTQTNPVDPASEDAILRYAETSLAATRADDALLRYADSQPSVTRGQILLERATAATTARADDAILRLAGSQPAVTPGEAVILRWADNN